ncbi:helix-turn-helix domain-containing protein [Niallia taxi]|uniref:helix-turn-helix domain-containing protein n=1 Tax=Niallia taxi TaxID=2499688 RepID=UPI002E1A1D7D|nr:helix-turn-helix domain-containing protein [Niallia taxi]
MSLGSRLKNEREKRSWSQLYVASKIGITNAVLSNYERDVRDPDTSTLKKLADLYEVSTDYLIAGQKKPLVAGTEINLTPQEYKIFEELKRHPILFHDLAKDPEKKIKELIKLQKAKNFFLEDDEGIQKDGFGELDD